MSDWLRRYDLIWSSRLGRFEQSTVTSSLRSRTRTIRRPLTTFVGFDKLRGKEFLKLILFNCYGESTNHQPFRCSFNQSNAR